MSAARYEYLRLGLLNNLKRAGIRCPARTWVYLYDRLRHAEEWRRQQVRDMRQALRLIREMYHD